MKILRESLGLALICLSLIAAAVWGIVEAFTTRIELNIDRILMVCVGLLIGGLFSLMLFVIAREQGWLPTRHKQSESAATTASTETPRASMPAAPKTAAPSSAQSKSPAQEAR